MVREAVALFHASEPLETAVSQLQSRGFDHADLSFLAHGAAGQGARGSAEGLAADPQTPREAATTDTDIRQQRLLGTSLAACCRAICRPI